MIINNTKETMDDTRAFEAILTFAKELRAKKRKDYGTSYMRHGSYGLLIRMHDKLERLHNLIPSDGKRIDPKVQESVYDTAIDIVNYAAMLAMLEKQ